jgi:Legume lectin domain/PEP-CTERM motif
MKRLLTLLGACATTLAALPALAVTVVYNDFSSLGAFQQNGATAAIVDPVTDSLGRKVLRLTDSLNQAGSAFLTNQIDLSNNTSFSTFFTFRISNPQGISDGDGQGADGLVFVVQTVSNTAGGFGGGIGYLGIPKSVGVEFDTWNNGSASNDPDGNHVGINLNGVFGGSTASIGTRMNNGADWFAWVDYNGNTDVIELRLSQSNVRPGAATLSRTADLTAELGTNLAYVGFTSGTGGAGGYHDIVNRQFRDNFAPINETPEPGSLALLGIAGLALGLTRRRRT